VGISDYTHHGVSKDGTLWWRVGDRDGSVEEGWIEKKDGK